MPAAPRTARSYAWVLPWTIVLGALIVRAIVLLQLGGHPLLQPRGVLDDAVYVKLATRVASGDLALGPDVYYLSPFYTYFLGLVFAVSGGSIAAARIVQVLLGASAVGLVMLTATAWFGRKSGLVAGALAGATGIFAFNEILILQSSIDPFLAALALFLLTRALQGRSWPSFLAAGAAFGALSLNRPNALPVVGAAAVAWFAACRSRQSLRDGVALVLGTALLLAPVAVRNRAVSGEWVLITSHGGLNFFIGNAFKADGTFKSVPGVRPSIEGQKEDVRKVAGEALGHPVTASEASSYFYDQAWQWIRSHPGGWAKLLARKALLTFHSADLALNYSYLYFLLDEPTFLSVLLVGPWLVVPLGLLGLVAAAPRRQWRGYAAWAVFVPVYAATLIAFFVSSRYRLALLVPLVTGAGAGLVWLWEALAARRTRSLVTAAIALVAMGVVFNWPIAAEDGRMYEREERAVRYVVDGQIEQGKRLLDETEPLHANRAVMLYRAGLAFRDRNDPDNAIVYLERAQKYNPTEPWIDFNLGEALLQAGRIQEALPHLEKARAAKISPTTVTYDFVGAYDALGQRDRARAELATIEIRPDMDGNGLLELGASAMKLEDLPLAEKFLRAAIARAPQSASAHEHLGVALGMAGRAAEAVPEMETALRLDPRNAVTQFHLAVAYAQLNRFAEARAAAVRTLQLDPNYAPARAFLGQLAR